MQRLTRLWIPAAAAGLLLTVAGAASAQLVSTTVDPVDFDRWMYPFNGTPGTRNAAPTFNAIDNPDFDNKDGQMIVAVDTVAAGVAAGQGVSSYTPIAIRVRVTHSTGTFDYDPSYDAWQTYLDPLDPEYVADVDDGRPLELYGVGFRAGYSGPPDMGPLDLGPPAFDERDRFCEGCSAAMSFLLRNVFPLDFGTPDPEGDVSNNVIRRSPLTGSGFDPDPWAIGVSTSGLSPGDPVPEGVLNASAGETFELELNLADPDVFAYVQQGLDDGVLGFAIVSMHESEMFVGGTNPNFYTSEAGDSAAILPAMDIEVQLPEPGARASLACGVALLAFLARRRE